MTNQTSKHPRIARRKVLKAAAAVAAGTLPATSTSLSSAQGESAGPSLESYVYPLSLQAGDKVQLRVSSSVPLFHLEIFRVGRQREMVWSEINVGGREQPVPADASTQGCGWDVTYEVTVPKTWRSGYYSVRLRGFDDEGRGAYSDSFFVVRPTHPGRDAKILLQLSSNTYNAYNDYAGSSLYAGGDRPLQGIRVSFERPLPRGFLSKPSGVLNRWSPYSGWHNWERAFVAWAEGAGYQIDYALNSDLEFRPEILDGYRLVLSVGHDEYWSKPMRDHLEAFITNGGNVAFFSGNTCYWQVRSEDDGRALVCYKTKYRDDPYYKSKKFAELSTLWANHLIGRPENQLTGVSFNYAGYHRFRTAPQGAGGYTIHRPEHWIFEGTGLRWGDLFGANASLVGYECDGCEFTLQHQLPVPTHRDGTPEGFEILATAPAGLWPGDFDFAAESIFGETHTAEQRERVLRGSAVLGMYQRGGTVFTTGCTEWSRGLEARHPGVERVTRNILDRLSRPT